MSNFQRFIQLISLSEHNDTELLEFVELFMNLNENESDQ